MSPGEPTRTYRCETELGELRGALRRGGADRRGAGASAEAMGLRALPAGDAPRGRRRRRPPGRPPVRELAAAQKDGPRGFDCADETAAAIPQARRGYAGGRSARAIRAGACEAMPRRLLPDARPAERPVRCTRNDSAWRSRSCSRRRRPRSPTPTRRCCFGSVSRRRKRPVEVRVREEQSSTSRSSRETQARRPLVVRPVPTPSAVKTALVGGAPHGARLRLDENEQPSGSYFPLRSISSIR